MCPPNGTEAAIARAKRDHKRGTGSAEAVEEARRTHAAAKAEKFAADLVADWPPLTDAQRDRVAALLRPTTKAASS